MRDVKALAAALLIVTGGSASIAFMPTSAFAQVTLEQALSNAVAALGANATAATAKAAIDGVFALYPNATPAQKAAALDASRNSAAGKPNVSAMVSALSLILNNPALTAQALQIQLGANYDPAVAAAVTNALTPGGTSSGAVGGAAGSHAASNNYTPPANQNNGSGTGGTTTGNGQPDGGGGGGTGKT